MNIFKMLRVLFGADNYPNCRCCKTQIKDNGVGLFPLGMGFCHRCAAEILRKR